jgi:hypothetical protein
VFRYANGTTVNRPMDISVNGDDRRRRPGVQRTGAWTTWQDVTITAPLTAGANKIKATSPPGQRRPRTSTTSSAEVGAAVQATTTSPRTRRSPRASWSPTTPGSPARGFVNYDNVVGSYVEWTVTAAQAGAHVLTFRYANGTAVEPAPGRHASTAAWRRACRSRQPARGRRGRRPTVTLPLGGEQDQGHRDDRQRRPERGQADIRSAVTADTERPTPPSGLRSTGKTATTVSLAWDAATDNVGVTGYDVYQHGQLVKSVGNVLQATATGLIPTPSTTGPCSPRTPRATSREASNLLVRTDPAPPDTVAPTTPGTLRSPGKTATTWTWRGPPRPTT